MSAVVSKAAISRRQFVIGGSATAAALMLPGCLRSEQMADVAVLGAGYAGLQATRLLRAAGVRVLLLEGRNRVGGRVRTFDHLPGKPEAGATEMGRSYTTLLELCRRFGVGEKSLENRYAFEYALSIGGALLSEQQWPGSEHNRLAADERGTAPHRLLSRYLPRQLPVDSLDDWGSRRWAEQDIPLADYLRGAGASPEAVRLIAANLNGHDIEDLSWADQLKSLLRRRNASAPGTFQVDGGLSQVTAGLEREVGDSLMKGCIVRRIAADGERLRVSCDNGTGVTARVVISALPFSTLRHVKIAAPVSEAKRAAIAGLRYTAVSRVYLRAKKPFWLDDGLPANTWTDSALGRLFVNSIADEGAGNSINVFAMGPAAVRLEKLLAQGKEQVPALLGELRPSTAGAVEYEDSVVWGSDPMTLGAFSHYPAGGVSRYGTAMAGAEGSLVFAGEHTEIQAAGVEAALVSGSRAATEAMAMLTRVRAV